MWLAVNLIFKQFLRFYLIISMNYKFSILRRIICFAANLKKPTTAPTVPITERGRLIFSEDFNNLNEAIWSRDIKMPLGPVSTNFSINTKSIDA